MDGWIVSRRLCTPDPIPSPHASMQS